MEINRAASVFIRRHHPEVMNLLPEHIDNVVILKTNNNTYRVKVHSTLFQGLPDIVFTMRDGFLYPNNTRSLPYPLQSPEVHIEDVVSAALTVWH